MSKGLRTKDIEEHRLRAVGPVRAGQRHAYGTMAPKVRAWLEKHGAGDAASIARDLGIGGDATANGVRNALQRGVASGEVAQPFRGVFALPGVAANIRAIVDAYKAIR